MKSHAGTTSSAASDARSSSNASSPYVLFYDGSCGLCRRSVEAIQRREPLAPMEYVDVTDDQAMERYPEIDRDKAMESVTLLEPDGTQRSAYDAFTGVLRILPRWRRAHFATRLWPVQFVGRGMYHLVGHNRHALSRVLGWE